MDDESVLTPEIRALIGVESDVATFDITAKVVRRTMEVFGITGPCLNRAST